MNKNLFAAIRHKVSDPARPFLTTLDGQQMTYGQMVERSAAYANVLTDLGVTPGDRVAVQVEKCTDVLMLYLGCLRAGGVFLPLNTGYTEAELDYFIGDAEPRVVVCDPGKAAAIAEIAEAKGVAHTETLGPGGAGSLPAKADGTGTAFEDVHRDDDDLAAILYTSGTTGRSKGAMISHANLRSNAETLVNYWRFTADDVLLHALPIFHTHGLFVATNTVLLSGASMNFLSRFDLDTVIAEIPNATAMMGVPTFYIRLLTSDALTPGLVKNIRLFVSGSAPLSAEVHKEFSARAGHAILERYGMTETNMNTSNPYDGERRPGTVGFPLPGVEIQIADTESGAPLPNGEVGSIEIRGPNVFSGYWRQPEKTKSEFRDNGFFISGDLGVVDEDGYISIVGRNKDLIISGGYNVYPAEIETAIDAIVGVAESAVIGVPHPDFGEGVTAVVAAKSGAALDGDTIQSDLATTLAKYKVPKAVIVVENLPRNTMGKIQKNVLRDQYQNLFAK